MTGQSSYSSPSSSPPQPLKDEEVQYLSLILEIIDNQNWEALGYAILSNPTVFQSFMRTIQQSDELNGMTILHACVRFNPPTQIIKILLDLVPESPRAVDCLQRTPLHVACGTHASVEVIKLLASAYPAGCTIQDEDGKTPLHLACDNACELFEGDNTINSASSCSSSDSSSKNKPPSYGVVRTLVNANPLCAPIEDQDGMSALEHAIFSDAPIKVVKLLQYATKRHCEKEQARESLKRSRRVSQDEDSQDGAHVQRAMKSMSMMATPTTEQLKQSLIVEVVEDSTVIPATKSEFSSRRRRGGIVAQRNIHMSQAA